MIGKNAMKVYYLKMINFCSTLNIEGITDADYAHTKGVCNDFEIKHLREYHDLYVYILS